MVDRCLLCMQISIDLRNYIPINSPKWLESNILTIIEKHFWPIENMQNIRGICDMCWSKIDDFQVFYKTIEEVHCRDIKLCPKDEIEMEIFQLSTPQIFKVDFTSNENSNPILDDLKFEDSFNEEETLICVTPTTMNGEMEVIRTEKRKRGRPRKKCNINIPIISKPKRKRGRPRKNIHDGRVRINVTSFQNDSSATYRNISTQNIIHQNNEVQQHNYTFQQKTPQQTALSRIISPVKVKRGRGRPRKIQQEEIPNTTTANHLEAIFDNEVDIDQSPAQQEEVINEMSLNLKEPEKLVQKKYKLLKKRRRMQQHKALMRNYIATSMRCMKFFQK